MKDRFLMMTAHAKILQKTENMRFYETQNLFPPINYTLSQVLFIPLPLALLNFFMAVTKYLAKKPKDRKAVLNQSFRVQRDMGVTAVGHISSTLKWSYYIHTQEAERNDC